MFTDPYSHGTQSFQVPTYEAVKGILRSIYWKPTFVWIPDELRVMNRICTEEYSVQRRVRGVVQKRLMDVRYQVRAHFVWNENRPEFADDCDENKHFRIALRSLANGGRFPVWLGTADCCGEVRSAHFGSGVGFYDNSGIVDFGIMYHGVMEDGVIRFASPEQCNAEFVRLSRAKRFGSSEDKVAEHAAGRQN